MKKNTDVRTLTAAVADLLSRKHTPSAELWTALCDVLEPLDALEEAERRELLARDFARCTSATAASSSRC